MAFIAVRWPFPGGFATQGRGIHAGGLFVSPGRAEPRGLDWHGKGVS